MKGNSVRKLLSEFMHEMIVVTPTYTESVVRVVRF